MSDDATLIHRLLKMSLCMGIATMPMQNALGHAMVPILDGHVEKTGPWTERVYRKVGGWGPFGGELETAERRRLDRYYPPKEWKDSLTEEEVAEIRRGFGLDGC